MGINMEYHIAAQGHINASNMQLVKSKVNKLHAFVELL
jgi:hypothetical protein